MDTKIELKNSDFETIVEKLRQDPKAKVKMIRMDAVALGAEVVRNARNAAGYSQAQLARRMGVSQPRISSIERADGTDGPTLAMLLRVADACGLELHLDFRVKTMTTSPPRSAEDQKNEGGVVVTFPKAIG